jgi:hypothetical protein
MPHSLRVGTESARQRRQSNWHGEVARMASYHFERSAWALFIDEVTPMSYQHGVTPYGGHKPDKEF